MFTVSPAKIAIISDNSKTFKLKSIKTNRIREGQSGEQGLSDALLAVTDAYLDAKLLMDVLGQMLGGVDAAVLTAGAAEGEHQTGEATLDIATHMGIGELIDGVEEGEDLAVVLKEADDGFVESRQLLVRLITTGVVGGATVEHIAAAVAALVVGNALAIGEAEDLDHQRTLRIVFGEGGGTVLRMGFIGVFVGNLVTVGTRGHGLYLTELGQLGELLQQADEMGIRERAIVEQLTQVLHGGRYGLNEMLLALEVTAETVSTQHLKLAEEDKESEPLNKLMG